MPLLASGVAKAPVHLTCIAERAITERALCNLIQDHARSDLKVMQREFLTTVTSCKTGMQLMQHDDPVEITYLPCSLIQELRSRCAAASVRVANSDKGHKKMKPARHSTNTA